MRQRFIDPNQTRRRHTDSVTSNAFIAKQIVGIVLSKVKAANWDQYDPSRRSNGRPAYEATNDDPDYLTGLDVCLYKELRPEVAREQYFKWTTAHADVARRALSKGCGNCGEMASIAFTLALEKGCKIVEFMSFDEEKGDPDHAFCVLGRDARTDLARPATWGADCWFCDPWAAGLYRDRTFGAFPAPQYRQFTSHAMGLIPKHPIVVGARVDLTRTGATAWSLGVPTP